MKVYHLLSSFILVSLVSALGAQEEGLRELNISVLGLGHSPGKILIQTGEEEWESLPVRLNEISAPYRIAIQRPLKVYREGLNGLPGPSIRAMNIPPEWQDVLLIVSSASGQSFYVYPMKYGEEHVPENSVVIVNFTNTDMAARIDDSINQIKPGLNHVESLGSSTDRRFVNLNIALNREGDAWEMIASRRLAMLKDSRMLVFVHFFADEQDDQGRWVITPVRQRIESR